QQVVLVEQAVDGFLLRGRELLRRVEVDLHAQARRERCDVDRVTHRGAPLPACARTVAAAARASVGRHRVRTPGVGEGASEHMSQLQWRPLSPFGAAVDLDLTGEVGDATIAELQDLFDRHYLLVFAGQRLSGEEQKRISGWFGPVADDKPAS